MSLSSWVYVQQSANIHMLMPCFKRISVVFVSLSVRLYIVDLSL